MTANMSDFGARAEDGAVNVYQNDMADEFPVLKAFQQYIDSEQAKSRKRMMLLCVFFSFVLTVVIGVFVILLIGASSRNQTLNDRLVEYAMKDRERAPVVATPSRDDAAIKDLSARLTEITKTIVEDRERSEKAEELKMQRSAEALEIERLKVLLAAEKEKAAAEREKQRQAELEAYRRKHYPELYEKKTAVKTSRKSRQAEEEEADCEIESILNEVKAIEYFDEKDGDTPSKEDVAVPTIKDSSGNTWGIPEE